MQIQRAALAAMAAVAAVMAGCVSGTQPPGKDQGPLRVLVAASTKDAAEEVTQAFAKDENIPVTVSADDSSRLATQIVNGAPAHLFLSANEKWADLVRDKGFATESRALLGNTLIIVVPKGNPAGVRTPEDLVGPKVKRIALGGPTVPAGIYARQALKSVGLWERAEPRCVSGENVRVALAYVERGEADAGIVYATDARVTAQVEQAYPFAESTHDPIRYPLVLLKAVGDNAQARRLYDFLSSRSAGDIFKKHGFTWLGGG